MAECILLPALLTKFQQNCDQKGLGSTCSKPINLSFDEYIALGTCSYLLLSLSLKRQYAPGM